MISSTGSRSPNHQLYETYRAMKSVQRTEPSKPVFYKQKKVALDKLEDIMKRLPESSPEPKASPSRASFSSSSRGKRPVSIGGRFTCNMAAATIPGMEAALHDMGEEDGGTSIAGRTRNSIKNAGKSKPAAKNKPSREMLPPPPAAQDAQEVLPAQDLAGA